MNPITIEYAFRPIRRSLISNQVADLFGLSAETSTYTIVRDCQLDVQPGDLVLFTGPSGSGKSSLLRAVAQQCSTIDVLALPLPDCPLIDALSGSIASRLDWLSACGLSEARLMLRTAKELSDGQRYRFRLAYGFQKAQEQTSPTFLLADEFAAILDRTLAKVLSFNLRKLVARTQIGILLATTHEDLTSDLQPNLWVRCWGEGRVEPIRNHVLPQSQKISFHQELTITDGSLADWPRFAAWHYRSHHLAYVRRVVLLKHQQEPIGICVFTSPAASLHLRSKYFGLQGKRTSLALQALNQQLWLLSRVVLHPTYRGAGIATWFVQQACASCPVPWIETLSAMGQINPFFERAGFQRIGLIQKDSSQPHTPSTGHFGTRRGSVSAETLQKSRFSEPIYYVWDNRRHAKQS